MRCLYVASACAVAAQRRLSTIGVVVGAAGLLYATTSILVSCNIQSNRRGLAALMLDALVVRLLVQLDPGGPWWLWTAIAVLSGMIILTHKMTSQLLYCWTVQGASGYLRRQEPERDHALGSA